MAIQTGNFKITQVEKSRIHQLDPNNIVFGSLFTDHMLVADYINGEWKTPEILPYGKMEFTPALASLHYGQAIFEGMKAFKSDSDEVFMFRPLENFKRFNISAERMSMPAVPEEIFIGGLEELLRLDAAWVPKGGDNSLYLRPFMFSTDEYLGVRTSLNYRFMIIMSPAGPYYSKPPKVKVETEYIRAAPGGVGYAKCAGNYAASLYPAKLAADQGYTQLLWTDAIEHKYFEESGTMNVMFVKDGKIITPAVSTTILKGTTRAALLQIAKDEGYTIEERKVSVEEIINGIKDGSVTEIFGVGTAVVVSPFSAVGYEGVDLELPEITEKSVSQILKTILNNIRTGKIADKYGWVWKVA
ncbi:branched chain amino acid aminotransferase apoenzyme [Leadbetterella byssophila DSM 17132]|uniref:branched-chain-amino-acid transaminase n=1 Tax=Leadbetterella byssophila (strain DSM 17132 / JCM 16389 / KACC 11308 / NBRC 106382 / 4M15) TaxID=649349 RepID=E4RQC5_LEAB4|nr:branched-chain amino acid aminotransferase [Leadbetterella byssophila]ADQ18333.1 branched chain amino acid aminotransferase apoenzyme [Leadbetterella byssophila DSM 17132]